MADAGRSRVAPVLDGLAAILFIVAIAIELTGGFMASAGGLRVSARSVDRAAFAMLGVIVVRLAIDRRTRPFGMSQRRFDALRRRAFDRTADTLPVPGLSVRPRAWLAFLGICAAAVVILHPQLRHMYSVPDLGDPLFSIWRMGWVYEQLRGDPRGFFDGNIFHPEPLTLTYSDAMPLVGAAAAPLLALGVHPVLAYNLLFVSGFVLSGIALYLLAVRLTGSRRAAFVAALIFGFYPYRFEHYSHLELQMTFWMPLALIAIHRYVDTAQSKYAIAAALLVVAQLYTSMYYAVFFLLYAAAAGAVLFAFGGHTARRLLKPAAAAGGIALLLAIPLARPYIAAREIKGDRGHDAVRMFSATASDYLRAHNRSALYGPHGLPGRQIERALFPGLLPIALAATAFVPPLGVTRLAYAAGLLLAFDGSLGFNGLTYPYLYEWFVPIRGMRVPARFSVILGMTLAVLAAFGARRLLARQGRTGTAIFAALVGAAIVDVWPTIDVRPVWREPPPIYASIAGDPKVVLAEFPLNTDPFGFADNTPYMYFSLWHWSEMVNGYSGHLPASYEELVKALPEFPNDESLSALAGRGVTHVSINCGLYRGPCDLVLGPVRASPRLRPVAEGQWQGEPVYLFQLLPK